MQMDKYHNGNILFMPKQRMIAFAVPKEMYDRGRNIPRGFNVSEELRKAYDKILKLQGL
jgi:hypothetical protein